jgi:hypothetical protein
MSESTTPRWQSLWELAGVAYLNACLERVEFILMFESTPPRWQSLWELAHLSVVVPTHF